MENLSQYFQTLLISFVSSSIVLIISAYYFSSSQHFNGFVLDGRGLVLIAGIIVAIIHGLLTGIFLILMKADSFKGTILASVLAMLVIPILVCVLVLILNIFYFGSNKMAASFDLTAAFNSIWFLLTIFFLLTVLLAIPALVIGLFNRLISVYFQS
jgi:hypothetical protein